MSDAAATPATTPTKIEQRGPRTLGVTWADGAESLIDVRELRLACACAQCVDEWTGAERLDPSAVPADVFPLKVSGVGRYAVQIEWSDGHASGIYPYRRLRALGDELAARRG